MFAPQIPSSNARGKNNRKFGSFQILEAEGMILGDWNYFETVDVSMGRRLKTMTSIEARELECLAKYPRWREIEDIQYLTMFIIYIFWKDYIF